MKRIIVLLAVFLSATTFWGQTENNQLQLHSFKESRSADDMPNLLTQFLDEDWPKDKDGMEDCALIRVKFENMPMTDAKKVTFKVSNSSSIEKTVDRLNEFEHEVWLFASPTSSTFLEAELADKNLMSNRLPDVKLGAKGVYDVILKNDKTVSIVVITIPENATAVLETGQKAFTPNNISGVSLGKHTLTISLNGQKKLTQEIEVTEENTKFGTYDLREKKLVTFKSDPSGAVLYINGEEIGRTPLERELPYDSYNVEAKYSSEETDSRAITVNALSEDVIKLEPIRKKTFEVFATYNGRKVDADLYIDGQKEETRLSSYTLTKPIGKTYDMRMMYFGDSKKRKIRITPDMNVEQEFKISARNSFVWPWQREYNPAPVGLSAAYVSKQLVTEGEGEKYKENGFWDDGEGESLHGVQLGLHFQPCFSFGLGLYSGLFYELYMSFNDNYDYNEFMEHNLYIPIHAYYRLPFSENTAFSIHGGLGFNYVVHGEYTDSDDMYEAYTDFYGENAFPKRFNLTAEIGFGIRFGSIQINAQYSKGLNDHESYSSMGDYTTHQNKLSIGVSYMITGD